MRGGGGSQRRKQARVEEKRREERIGRKRGEKGKRMSRKKNIE